VFARGENGGVAEAALGLLLPLQQAATPDLRLVAVSGRAAMAASRVLSNLAEHKHRWICGGQRRGSVIFPKRQ